MMALDHAAKIALLKQANEVRQFAYAPYSKYPVGAALLTSSGKIYTGVNIENAAFPDGICAERVAVFKAVSEGEKTFTAVAVVTPNGGTPCGSCRQVLAEFSRDMVDSSGECRRRILTGNLTRNITSRRFHPGSI